MNHGWLERVSFLQELLVEPDEVGRASTVDQRTPAYLKDMALALQNAIFPQTEIFGKPWVLYILRQGLVARDSGIHRSGSVWGEDFLLSDAALTKPARSFALTYAEVSYLERAVFMKIVE